MFILLIYCFFRLISLPVVLQQTDDVSVDCFVAGADICSVEDSELSSFTYSSNKSYNWFDCGLFKSQHSLVFSFYHACKHKSVHIVDNFILLFVVDCRSVGGRFVNLIGSVLKIRGDTM